MTWIMTHPWMTFFLVAFGLMVLDNAIANICQTVTKCRYIKACAEAEEQPKPPEEGK